MNNAVASMLRPRRLPEGFNLPLELARSHGITGSSASTCSDTIYVEGYGMIPNRQPHAEPTGTPKTRIVMYIDDILRRFCQALYHDPPQKMTMTLIRKRRGTEYWHNSQTNTIESRLKISAVVYTAPNPNRKKLIQFSRLIKLIAYIMVAIKNRSTVLKRELFYYDPDLFQTQSVVNRLVEDIALTCHVQLEDLYVAAESRYLVTNPQLDGSITDSAYLHSGQVKWLLVVEKETVFHHLRQRSFAEQSNHGPGIILTGKGYPGHETHHVLREILKELNAPVLGLFDCDPDGFQIAKTYMSPHTFHPSCPQMIRLIEPSRFVSTVAAAGNETALMPLTSVRQRKANRNGTQTEGEGAEFGGDRKKIRDILTALQPNQSAMARDLRRDLQTLQMVGRKGEIEALEDGANGMIKWLEAEMAAYMKRR